MEGENHKKIITVSALETDTVFIDIEICARSPLWKQALNQYRT